MTNKDVKEQLEQVLYLLESIRDPLNTAYEEIANIHDEAVDNNIGEKEGIFVTKQDLENAFKKWITDSRKAEKPVTTNPYLKGAVRAKARTCASTLLKYLE